MRRLAPVLIAGMFFCVDVQAQSTAADHTFGRAGNSQSLAPWARPSQTPKMALGYLGRAVVFGVDGSPRLADGVVGYDCAGHGWSSQSPLAPPGPYRTDGRRVFDVFSIRPLRRALATKESESHEAAGHAVIGDALIQAGGRR